MIIRIEHRSGVLTEMFLVSGRMPGLRVLVVGHGHNCIAGALACNLQVFAPGFHNISDSCLSRDSICKDYMS